MKVTTRWMLVGLAVIGVALALRAGFLVVFMDSPLFVPLEGGHDRTIYHDAARQVADGFIWPEGAFTYMPLYPWILGAGYWLFGESLWVPSVLGIIFDALTLCFLFLLARRLSAPLWGAALATGLYAAYPLAIVYAPLTMPNTLNTCLVTVLTWTLLRLRPTSYRDWGVAGLVAGVTALGFAGALLIFAGFLALQGVRGARERQWPWQGIAVSVLCLALPLLPVSLHNSRAEGTFVLLSTHGGFNFYMGNHVGATGYPVRVADFRMSAAAMLEDAHAAAQQAEGRSLSRAESSSWWRQQGWAFWRAHPVAAMGLTLKKAALFWNYREVDDLRMLEQLRLTDQLFTGRFWPGFGFFAILGGLGLLYARRAAVPKLVVLAVMLSVAGFFITARYRLTVVPLMALLGAVAWPELVRLVRLRSWRLAGIVPLLILVAYPVEIRDQRPVDYHNAAVQILDEGQVERALDLANKGLEIDPAHADLHHVRGHALALLDEYDAAAEAFARTVQLNPRHASGRYNWALSLARLGRACEAVAALEPWVRQMPGDLRAAQLYRDLRPFCEAVAERESR